EKGVAGVDVVLQSRSFSYSAGNSAQWQFEQRAVTDKGGYYLFSGLRGGVDANCEYRVVFMPPKQYENTELDLGGNDTTDSDAHTVHRWAGTSDRHYPSGIRAV
ncbi:MAG: SdrD B-like domain-containing protein, partial [Oscillospiraceae bacterium]